MQSWKGRILDLGIVITMKQLGEVHAFNIIYNDFYFTEEFLTFSLKLNLEITV